MSTSTSPGRKPLYLVFSLMLFCFCSIGSARMLLSLYALHLGASPSNVGLLAGSLYLFPLLISWPVGRYSDRVGSRALLLFASANAFCAMMIPYFISTIPALYAASLLLGFSFTIYNVLLQNLVGLLSKPEELPRNFSNASLVGATTMFLGPLIAGISIDLTSHATACLVLSMLSLGAATLLVTWGGLLPGGSRQRGGAGGIREALKDRAMLRLLVTSSLVQVAQDLYHFYIPVHGHAAGLSASAIGTLLAAMAAASFFARVWLPRLIARLGQETVLAYSFGLVALGFVLVPFFGSAIALGLISFMFGLGMGCGQPITTMLIYSRSAPGRSGETLGLRQSVNNLLRVSAPGAFGFVATIFGLPAVFVVSGLIMGGGGLLARPRRSDRK